jgi:hypothetical protein
MSSAPQGPGWWQASDGNWYPPQEQSAGYEAPPPPAAPAPPGPPSWSAPPAPPQYPAPGGQYPAPGGQNFGNAQAVFASALAKVPLAGWLLFGGFVVAQISTFLPWFSANVAGIVSISASLWTADGGVAGFFFLILAAGAVLSLLIFTRPQNQRPLLIALSAVVGALALHLLYNWVTMNSQLNEAKGDASVGADVSVSPQFGIFLYTLAIGFLVVRVVMMWMALSKPRPQAY